MNYSVVIDAMDMQHINGKINNEIDGYSNSGYLTALVNENDCISVESNIPHDGYYKLAIRYALPVNIVKSLSTEIETDVLQKQAIHRIFINDECYGSVEFDITNTFICKEI